MRKEGFRVVSQKRKSVLRRPKKDPCFVVSVSTMNQFKELMAWAVEKGILKHVGIGSWAQHEKHTCVDLSSKNIGPRAEFIKNGFSVISWKEFGESRVMI